jgi:hypothetical protein
MPPKSLRRSDLKDLARVAIPTQDATFFNRFGQLIYRELLGRAAGYEHPYSPSIAADLQMVLPRCLCARVGHDRLR